MPPQKKRGREGQSGAKGKQPASSSDDAGRSGADEVEMMDQDDSDDSDDDSDDDLTFAAKAEDSDEEEDSDEDMEDVGEQAAGAAADADANARSVNVEFVFSDPKETHFHSVKQFLLTYMPPTQPFDVSGLADAVVGQVSTGTMVCVEGEDDVYGFITALSLERYAQETSVQQIVQYVTKKCPPAELPRLQQILSTKSVGLVVNERMVNLPYQLVPAIHSALHEDIEWAIENEDTPELRASFQFDYFLLLASCAVEKSGSGGKGSKKTKTAYEQTAKFFHNFEDEFLEQEAELSFSFDTPVGDRESVDKSNKSTVVMLIERAKHKAALAQIAAMINA
jgi:protein BCP1